jgi:epoxyqueuosine reductase
MATVQDLALAAGLSVARVTSAEPFAGVEETLNNRVAAGNLAGMDWFTPERSTVSANPRALHPTAQSIISVGIPYFRSDIHPPSDGVLRGRIARYAWGKDYHKTLKKRMETLRTLLEQEFGSAINARLLVDTARIVDRAVAARSGLGWYGKHTNIIVPHHGSFVMLGELLVDIALPHDEPLVRDCGSCAICLHRCPTGAIREPYLVHAPDCISFQTIEQRGAIPEALRAKMGNWVFGCDVCQDVCPYTGAAREMIDEAFAPTSIDNAFPSLSWLLEMDEAAFRAIYSGTAVTRTRRAGLARNAAIAIGNSGSVDHLPVLEYALIGHDTPLVRVHAAWAIGTLGSERGHDILRRSMAQERDEAVQVAVRSAARMLERIEHAKPTIN